MRKVTRRRLSPSDGALLARAMLWMLAVDLGLKVMGFDRLQGRLRCIANPQGVAGPGHHQWSTDKIERLCQLVQVAARHHLYGMGCLPQALTAQKLLALEGVQADLRIGVRKIGDRLDAHAWLEYQGCPIGEGAHIRDTFAVMGPVDASGIEMR